MPKPKSFRYPAEVEAIRAAAIPGGRSLLADVKAFKLTPVQAVTRFFESGKPSNTGLNYWRTLREILELLPQCDWDGDPSIGSVDGNRWVFMDPENENRVTTVFTSEQAVIEHGIKPLLGQAFDFKAWVEQLTHEQIPEPEKALQQLATAAAATQASTQHGEIGNGRVPQSRVAIGHSKPANQLSSNSWDRILPRLARDAPEILERVKAGEFRSARAAAIEAGIVKPVPTVRLVDDLAAVASKLRQHLTTEQLEQLKQLL